MGILVISCLNQEETKTTDSDCYEVISEVIILYRVLKITSVRL